MTPQQIRAACRAYAEKYVGVQREEFRRLGSSASGARRT